MYIARQLTGATLKEIGREFDGRHVKAQTTSRRMRKLRPVSFHVDYVRLAHQIGRLVSEPKVITVVVKLAGLGRVFVHRPDDNTTCTILLFASKVLNHPDVVA